MSEGSSLPLHCHINSYREMPLGAIIYCMMAPSRSCSAVAVFDVVFLSSNNNSDDFLYIWSIWIDLKTDGGDWCLLRTSWSDCMTSPSPGSCMSGYVHRLNKGSNHIAMLLTHTYASLFVDIMWSYSYAVRHQHWSIIIKSRRKRICFERTAQSHFTAAPMTGKRTCRGTWYMSWSISRTLRTYHRCVASFCFHAFRLISDHAVLKMSLYNCTYKTHMIDFGRYYAY